MALDLDAPDAQDGQTPLDPDEKAGLIPRHIETKGALNDWEQENILQATKWRSCFIAVVAGVAGLFGLRKWGKYSFPRYRSVFAPPAWIATAIHY